MMKQFFATLMGSEEVPPVQTSATGDTVFKVSDDQMTMRFRLIVNNIANMTVAHIHLGRRGENGPIVVFLFGPVDPAITVSQGIVQGTLSQRNLVGPLEGQPFSALLNEMQRGNTYVNVHTVQNPGGEIRGQISRSRTATNWA
ncbi:MAG TPA: CHRD domain-containing protein [Firmicutes bacterium]|nr:CHRD domain-containing protein [Bacillota bacterium]